MSIPQQLVASLFALALVSLGAAVVGLYAGPRESFRGFWFMCGIWGVIDGVIAWTSFVQEPLPLDELRGVRADLVAIQFIDQNRGGSRGSRQEAGSENREETGEAEGGREKMHFRC